MEEKSAGLIIARTLPAVTNFAINGEIKESTFQIAFDNYQNRYEHWQVHNKMLKGWSLS